MDIIVAFDDERLVSRFVRDGPLIFEIYWKHDGIYYPARGWTDFGAVILVWWLDATWRLREGETEVKYLFMEGSFDTLASLERDTGMVTLCLEGEWDAWAIPLDELIAALIRAATTVRDRLAQLGIGEQDRYSLEFGINRLR